jgi:hypothetical protein
VLILALNEVRRFAEQCRNRVGDVIGWIVPAEHQEIGKVQRQERRGKIGETVVWNQCTAPAKARSTAFRAVSSKGVKFIDRALHSSFH